MTPLDRPGRSAEDYRELVTRLLRSANRGEPLVTFLEEVTQILLETSRSGAVVIRLEEWTPAVRSRAIRRRAADFRFETERVDNEREGGGSVETPQGALCRALLHGAQGRSTPPFTPRGGLWTSDAQDCPPIRLPERTIDISAWARAGGFRSLVLLPFSVDGRPYGLLQMIHERAERFEEADVHYFEDVAEAFGVALTHHRVQWALQERVKELTCLYGIAKVAEAHAQPLPELLHADRTPSAAGMAVPRTLRGLDPARRHRLLDPGLPGVGSASVGRSHRRRTRRGTVEVVYLTPQPEMHEGAFLFEERNLINEIARQIALIVEGRQTEEVRQRLQDQLFHADRLATLGKLTAGVAHELNEPLGSILGFAQLAREVPGLSDQASQDLDKIVKAALHVREIIKKLMFFGRQTPPGMVPVDLNQTIHEGLSFIQPRMASQRIRLVQRLDPNLPRVIADPGQILQVLVNLMVNASQAMPDGGELTVATESDGDGVSSSSRTRGSACPKRS